MTGVTAGTLYRHYGGRTYIVLHVAMDTETLGLIVVYTSTDIRYPRVIATPLRRFNTSVDFRGKRVKRFTPIPPLGHSVIPV